MATKPKAGRSPFAHLGKSSETDDERDDKDAKGKAEGDEKDPKDTTDDADGKPKDVKGNAKGRADNDDDMDGDDDKDAEDEKDDEKAKARARERARCATIFKSPAAGRFPAAAAHLAFETKMPRSAAVSVLESTAAAVPEAAPTARAPSLRDRMAAEGVKPVPQEAAGASDEKKASTPGVRLLAALPANRR